MDSKRRKKFIRKQGIVKKKKKCQGVGFGASLSESTVGKSRRSVCLFCFVAPSVYTVESLRSTVAKFYEPSETASVTVLFGATG